MKTIISIYKRIGWLPVFVWVALIYWLSSQSEPVEPGIWLPPFADKLVHMILFGVLAWLIYPFIRIIGCSTFIAACTALTLSSLYGIFDELHQSNVPNRYMDVNDWIADTIGAATVFWLRARESRLTEFIRRLLPTS
jgi:VanZ family protein